MLQEEVSFFQESFNKIKQGIGKAIVGNEEIINLALSAFFAGGHALLEGVPGLGKTLLVKSISDALGLSFKRIQFTPDLMPSDITGTEVLTEDENRNRSFIFKSGPVFANIVLADEINRATPKTQAALLEAMEEKQVTVLDKTHKLPQPFFVLATQNPIELEGTYPLPEAQLDRFMVKIMVSSPQSEELKEILKRTTGQVHVVVSQVFSDSNKYDIYNKLKGLVRSVVVADPLLEVIARIISALTPGSQYATSEINTYVRFGPGPRGAQSLLLISKVKALMDGRINVSFEDIKDSLAPTLRHRLVLNFQAEADNITSDDLINQIKTAK